MKKFLLMIDIKEYKDIHKGKTIYVLGLGTSLRDFSKYKDRDDLITIGVNDIDEFMSPTYLLCLDRPDRFDEKRKKTIQNNKSENFITQLYGYWYFPYKNLIKIKTGSRNINDMDSCLNRGEINISNNSTYCACIIAYYMGAKNIALLGCDWTNNHYNNEDGEHKLVKRMNEIENDFKNLHKALLDRGCSLYNVSEISVLKSLPKMPLDEFVDKFNYK